MYQMRLFSSPWHKSRRDLGLGFSSFSSIHWIQATPIPFLSEKKHSFLLLVLVICLRPKKEPVVNLPASRYYYPATCLLSVLAVSSSSAVHSSSVYYSWFAVSNRQRDMPKSKKFMDYILRPFKSSSKKDEEGIEDWGKIAAQEQKHFPFETLVAATKNFHATHKLGQGGFGPVYKGTLTDGREIAVKKLSRTSNQGRKEFINEAKLLARVQHKNVVNLLGYCAHGEEKLLVYEYIQNESLDKLLFKTDRRQQLDWKRRFEIINGIARGLLYLHEDSHNCIIHRDIKASNILLDDKWVPKIADFGMARLFPEDQTHVNTRVAGTNGYMAPEYVMHGYLSKAADVFSFGVLVLELISGHRNSSFNLDVDAQNLLDWAYKLYKKGRSLELVDPCLASTSSPEQVSMCIEIGLLCTQSDPKLRPDIGRVSVLLSKRPGSLSLGQITHPGVPGSRYRRARRPPVGYSTSSASGSASATFGVNTSSMSCSTTSPTLPTYDSRGKRPSNNA